MPKIAFVGPGSTVFTKNLVGDVLATPELADTDTGPSVEFGARIVRACETGEPFAFNGNVPNRRPDGGAARRRPPRRLLRRGPVRRELSLEEIRDLVDALLEAHGERITLA